MARRRPPGPGRQLEVDPGQHRRDGRRAARRAPRTSWTGAHRRPSTIAPDDRSRGSRSSSRARRPDAPSVDGRWRLPTIGLEPRAGRGVGRTARRSSSSGGDAGVPRRLTRTSRFAHRRPHSLGQTKPSVIELAGAFDYDALSPDGSDPVRRRASAGVAGGAYQVRAVDVATGGVMRDASIVDKRNIDETMAGWPIAQLRRPDGIVLTLYRGAEHPFIHALNSIEAWAVCIDLPANGADDADGGARLGPCRGAGRARDLRGQRDARPGRRRRPAELAVRRTARLEPVPRRPAIVLAKFGHQELGAAGRRVVVAADGETIFAAGATGSLSSTRPGLTKDQGVPRGHRRRRSSALTPDGRTLFALELGSGRIVALDAARERSWRRSRATASTASLPSRRGEARVVPLLRVGAAGVELLADQAQLVGGRRRRRRRASSATRSRPADRRRGPARSSRPGGASRGASRRRRRSGRSRGR